jgi:hypothetical protein
VVEWDWPSSTGALHLDGFWVARGVGGEVLEVIVEVGNATRYIDTHVSRDTTYAYTVIAINPEWVGEEGDIVQFLGDPDPVPWYRDVALLTMAVALGPLAVWGIIRWSLGPGSGRGNG